MSEVKVECSASGSSWIAHVEVVDARSTQRFEVWVSAAELERFDPGASEPAGLVRRSFEFLLAREPKESILPQFNIGLIGRYFPEYESEIRGRKGA
jgi:hypothetical protein